VNIHIDKRRIKIVLKKNDLPWLTFADIVAPLLILGYAIGRVGCFLVGDDYGLPTKFLIGMTFENGAPPTTYGSFTYNYPWVDLSGWNSGDVITVFPTQIMETIIGLGIFYFLWKKRETIQVKGSLFFTYLIFAGIERFCMEFIRINPKYIWIVQPAFGLSGAQLISIIMIGVGTYFLVKPPQTSETKPVN